MDRIYIAGPMENKPDYKQNFNAAEQILSEDFEVINPVEIAESFVAQLAKANFDDIPYRVFFQQDINELLHCDAIFMLDGWEKSKGARAEHAVAVALGIEILYQQKIIRLRNEKI
jgi:nucleoside 2-deoxyribosyltransferase